MIHQKVKEKICGAGLKNKTRSQVSGNKIGGKLLEKCKTDEVSENSDRT